MDQDKDQWRAIMNTIMNLRFPYVRKFLSYCFCLSFLFENISYFSSTFFFL
jgi:hypothetical protein